MRRKYFVEKSDGLAVQWLQEKLGASGSDEDTLGLTVLESYATSNNRMGPGRDHPKWPTWDAKLKPLRFNEPVREIKGDVAFAGPALCTSPSVPRQYILQPEQVSVMVGTVSQNRWRWTFTSVPEFASVPGFEEKHDVQIFMKGDELTKLSFANASNGSDGSGSLQDVVIEFQNTQVPLISTTSSQRKLEENDVFEFSSLRLSFSSNEVRLERTSGNSKPDATFSIRPSIFAGTAKKENYVYEESVLEKLTRGFPEKSPVLAKVNSLVDLRNLDKVMPKMSHKGKATPKPTGGASGGPPKGSGTGIGKCITYIFLAYRIRFQCRAQNIPIFGHDV